MFKLEISELKTKAYNIRRQLIDLIYQAGSGHLDTSLSLVEIWLALVYSDFFRFDPHDGAWEGRDLIFLSEGHACPLQYLVNADLGYHSVEEVFQGNRKPDSHFQGHTRRYLPYGLENSNGSLGIAIWQAYGHALETDRFVFCIAGDGEFQEPSSIGLLTAPHNLRPASNYTLIINKNGLAQDSEVNLGPVDEIARIYNWQVMTIDGHDFSILGDAIHQAVADTDRPTMIICNTIKGKDGDPAAEGKLGYHGRPPKTEDEYRAYIDGLENRGRN